MENKISHCFDNGFPCKEMHEVSYEMTKVLERNRKLGGKIARTFNGDIVPEEIKARYINSVQGYRKAFLMFMEEAKNFHCVQTLLQLRPTYIQDQLDLFDARITFMKDL